MLITLFQHRLLTHIQQGRLLVLLHAKAAQFQLKKYTGLFGTLLDLEPNYREEIGHSIGVLPQVNDFAFKVFNANAQVKKLLTKHTSETNSLEFPKDFGYEARTKCMGSASRQKSRFCSL